MQTRRELHSALRMPAISKGRENFDFEFVTHHNRFSSSAYFGVRFSSTQQTCFPFNFSTTKDGKCDVLIERSLLSRVVFCWWVEKWFFHSVSFFRKIYTHFPEICRIKFSWNSSFDRFRESQMCIWLRIEENRLKRHWKSVWHVYSDENNLNWKKKSRIFFFWASWGRTRKCKHKIISVSWEPSKERKSRLQTLKISTEEN